MSKMLNELKAEQLQARKDRDTTKAGVLTALIGEASKITKDDHKRGLVEVDDERVIATMRVFVNNLDKSLDGYTDEESGVVCPPLPEGPARDKFLAERAILFPLIPVLLDETALWAEVALMAAEKGSPLTLKDTKDVREKLSAKFPGRISPRLLAEVLRNQPA